MVKTCRFGELGEEQITSVTKSIENQASVRVKVFFFERYAALDGFLLAMRSVPVHGLNEILSAGDKACTVEADETVAPFAADIAHTPGESIDITPVIKCNGGGDKAASLILTLCHNDGIGKACNDAVTRQEVSPLG